MKTSTRRRVFNNLIVYANQEELDVCLRLLIRFKRVLQTLIPYKLHRLSIDVIDIDFFACSLISNCDKIEFMLDRHQVLDVINGHTQLINQVLNERTNYDQEPD